jgi:hypothetical protein
MELFKIDIIYPFTNSLYTEDEELDELDRIRLGEEYTIDSGYFNLLNDPIVQINPKCLVPKGKSNKKYFSQVIFQSGNVAYVNGKPDVLFGKLQEYMIQLGDKIRAEIN